MHPETPERIVPPADSGRFAFGENWRDFVGQLGESGIAEARRGLEKLLPAGEIRGRRFLDLGCGSGLSMLAAMQLGAASVAGIDLDPNSIEAARTLLSRYSPGGPWTLRQADLLSLAPQTEGIFDIVYSWGVLHHTGEMRTALDRAAALVAPGGKLAVALYRRTPMCGFWAREKRLYAGAGPFAQAAIRVLYKAAFCAGLVATGRSPRRYIREYVSARGMSWTHDVHDWLGGYPYESIGPAEVAAALDALGFSLVRSFTRPAVLGGLLGSHCDEFVAARRY